MVGYLCDALCKVIVVLVNRLLFFIHRFGDYDTVSLGLLPDLGGDVRVIGDHLSDDIQSTLKGFLRSVDFFLRIHKCRCDLQRISLCVHLSVDLDCQRLQASFLGL